MNKINHYRIKSWSKELGSGILSQTDFTFGEKQDKDIHWFNSYSIKGLWEFPTSSFNRKIKRRNTFTPEETTDFPLENVNGRLDTFTNSERDSGLNRLDINPREIIKLGSIPQFYDHENEETQLIISELESIEGAGKQGSIKQSIENSLVESKSDSNEVNNIYNIYQPYVKETTLKKFNYQIPNNRNIINPEQTYRIDQINIMKSWLVKKNDDSLGYPI